MITHNRKRSQIILGKYYLEYKLKEGVAIIGMKQHWCGPNGAINSKWTWRL
ncbi:hypothetical protein [Clostridium sp. DL-VIII]|uniref:hypothetical protein n=1 Tax=Clostridium sp. DL-VIII TaxID=641107 RepID=UPI0002DED012|nr:hypothetical protein [Clostridium sp. DL-VIII]